MAILIKSKISNSDLQKPLFKDIVYDMAYNEVDEKTIYDNMVVGEGIITIDLQNAHLQMDILYFSRIIKGKLNRFLDKGIKRLVILSKQDISLDFFRSDVLGVSNKDTIFKDGFVISIVLV